MGTFLCVLVLSVLVVLIVKFLRLVPKPLTRAPDSRERPALTKYDHFRQVAKMVFMRKIMKKIDHMPGLAIDRIARLYEQGRSLPSDAKEVKRLFKKQKKEVKRLISELKKQ